MAVTIIVGDNLADLSFALSSKAGAKRFKADLTACCVGINRDFAVAARVNPNVNPETICSAARRK